MTARRLLTIAASLTLALGGAAWLFPGRARSHDELPAPRVFATAKAGKILRVDFEAGGATVLNVDGAPNVHLGGLALRDDGVSGVQLFVANRGAGVVWYEAPYELGQVVASSSAVGRPNALALDAPGNLFVVGPGNDDPSCDRRGRVLRLPRNPSAGGAGYGAPVTIDDTLQHEHLEDAEVVRFTAGLLAAGDLLVLARERPTVYRYAGAATATSPASRSVFLDRARLDCGAKPSGMAFLGRTLLVAVESGRVLRFDASGNRLSPDFVAGLGPGRYGVAVGGDGRVYVTRKHGSGESVRRYEVAANGTALAGPDIVTNGVNKPAGVDVTTSVSTPFTAGSNDLFATSFVSQIACGGDGWTADGTVAGRVLVFEDPRETEPGAPADPKLPLLRDLPLQEIDAALPNVILPRYARAFRKLGSGETYPAAAPSGPALQILLLMDSTTVCTDPPEVHGLEAEVYGYDPLLDQPGNRTAEPRWFYSPDADEPALLETPLFIDVTTGEGSTRGHTRDTSLFVHSRDTRPLDGPGGVADSGACTAEQGVVDCGLNRLRQAVRAQGVASHFACLPSWLRLWLKLKVELAIAAFECQSYTQARRYIELVEQLARENRTSCSACTQREPQEIRARALSLIYKLQKLEADH